jgi:DNA-binding NtrC family response regulator
MVLRTLLIVDDDPTLGRLVQDVLPVYRIVTAEENGDVIAALRRHQPAVVALSLKRETWKPADPNDAPEPKAAEGGDAPADGPANGLSALSQILAEAPSTKVIALTPEGQRLLAVRAVARGAHDVCQLPIDARELAYVVERAFDRSELEREGRRLNSGDAPPTLRVLRDEAERRALLDALARSGGNLSATARLLGVSRPTLYSLLRQHGVRTE